ncbi:obscurin-like isoform X1 [Carassius gibelio]|uniref:obscurin-like isoform X1 n=1 Tax=Carassius gibelio TaxID=101364 RepID=UPI0022776ABD|nr:obscurin-like isoform X1 [Carassius gibelio]
MADKRHMCLLGRIILCTLLTGMSGAEVTHVFFSSGEDVRLSCNNALPGCTSTTWIYSRPSGAVELIAGGIKKTDTERHERLSLGSDCSLNIKKVTKEDRGEYTCRQYVNGQQQGADARVYLHVLHVSSSPSQSEIRSGRSLTLSCQLYYDDRVSCDTLVRSEGLDLIWVNQSGVNLQTDSRFQISFSSEQCNISLTTTLLNEDHNREWRCQLKHRDQLKTSATYTVKYPTPSETKPPSPVTSSKSAAAPTQAGPESAVKINVYCDLKTSLRYTDMCSDNNTTFL